MAQLLLWPLRSAAVSFAIQLSCLDKLMQISASQITFRTCQAIPAVGIACGLAAGFYGAYDLTYHTAHSVQPIVGPVSDFSGYLVRRIRRETPAVLYTSVPTYHLPNTGFSGRCWIRSAHVDAA
jgi:hypothetical protein